MRNIPLCAVVLWAAQTIVAPATAEDRSQRFVDLMSHLPAAAFANRSTAMPEFLDFEAAARIVGVSSKAQSDEVKSETWQVLGGPFAQVPRGTDWARTVGFSQADLRAAVALREPPDDRMVLLLKSDAVPRVTPALLAHGYQAGEDKGFPAFWRGEEDFSINLDARDPDDPFAFPLPKSSRIAFDGDVLLQAASWPSLEAMVQAASPAPTLTSLAKALDLPDWGDRSLVQAVIFSDPTQFAPGFSVGENLTLAPEAPGLVPYWSNFLLADLSDGTSDLTLLVLLYAAKSDAETAASVLDANWGKSPLFSVRDKTLGDLAGLGTARVVGDGPYMAVYAIETQPKDQGEDTQLNHSFAVVMSAIYRRELSLLGPALP